MVGVRAVVELEALTGRVVLCVELPVVVTAVDVVVGPDVVVETGRVLKVVDMVVVALIVIKLLEVVPEVVVKLCVGVVPEVVVDTGLVDVGDVVGVVTVAEVVVGVLFSVPTVVVGGVDTEGVGPEVVVLVVDSVPVNGVVDTGCVPVGLLGPEVEVVPGVEVVGNPIGGLVVLVAVVSWIGVSVTGVVLLDLEGVGPEVVVMVVDNASVTSEVVVVTGLVDTGDVDCWLVVLAVDTVLISVVLVVSSGAVEGVTGVLGVVSGSDVSLRQEENRVF